jgi:DNA-binding transcriptional LysR family regulator
VADLAALQIRPVAEDRLVVAADAGHRIAGDRSIAFSEIVGEPIVGVSDAALETHLAERASRLGQQLLYRVRLKRVADVGSLVAAGVGIAVLSESSLPELDRSGLAIVPLRDAWAQRRLYLCARDFQALTLPATLLARHLETPGSAT